jgi:hypothetical protein
MATEDGERSWLGAAGRVSIVNPSIVNHQSILNDTINN